MTVSRITSPSIFGPVDQCIYCRSRVDLADEHVVPRSLNGSIILRRASCKACAKVTSKFEQTCARTSFGLFRLRNEMRTRRKKERPEFVEIDVASGDGASTIITAPVSGIPNVLFLLKFGHTATILLGHPDIDTSAVKPWIAADSSTLEGKTGWNVGKFDAFAFARMLAKIGHCLAATQFGLDEFTPLTLDFIFGRTKNLSHIVGGSFEDEMAASAVHWLRLRDHYDLTRERRFVVAHIRLFACLGAPSYHVAVGEVPWDSKLPGMTNLSMLEARRLAGRATSPDCSGRDFGCGALA